MWAKLSNIFFSLSPHKLCIQHLTMTYKTLRYEINGEVHTYECGPNTWQFDMTRDEVVRFFLNEASDKCDFFILGWDS